jgi:hypothetical protein
MATNVFALLRDRVPTSRRQGNLKIIRNIAPSLRLLVPSSLQIRRHSADMNHHHLRSRVPLDPEDHNVDPSDVSVTFLCYEPGGTARLDWSRSLDSAKLIRQFWRAFIRSLASCSLLRAERSQPSGVAAATTRTLRQVTRRRHPVFPSIAASSSAVGALSPSVSSPNACPTIASHQTVVSTLPSASWRCLYRQLHSRSSGHVCRPHSLAGIRGHSLLRWLVPPHCQHTGRLSLWLLASIDRLNTDDVGASLTGTSSWPSHSTWCPTSTDVS